MCNELIWVNNVYELFSYLRDEILSEDLLVKTVSTIWVVSIFVIAFIFTYLFFKKRRSEQKVSFQKKFDLLLGGIAICESEEELNEIYLRDDHQKMLKKFLSNDFDRNLLIDELAQTSKQFRGATLKNIRWLFEKMDLEKDLMKNLHTKKWHKKSKAIQQLSALLQKNSISEIFVLTNHQHPLVRMEAQIALLNLTGFSGLKFLETATYSISEWQQLRLIQELSKYPSNKYGNISAWIKSKNESVVNFALKLVEIYRLYDYYDEVKQCLSHPSRRICQRAIIALSQIYNETTADLLIDHYARYNTELQLRILKILQETGNEEQIPFLLSLVNDDDDNIKLEAAKAIVSINPAAIENIEKLVNEFRSPWNIILPQIKMEIVNEHC